MFLSEVVKRPVATVEPGFTVFETARHMVERNAFAFPNRNASSRMKRVPYSAKRGA